MCYNRINGGALDNRRMVQSLEQYVAQATQAYKPAVDAVQAQIDALPGQLEATNQQINKNYAQQQAGLNRNRNMAAESASMQAAGSGGSFGGAANLANRRYYDRTFVPAVTQLNTNQSNDLSQARQNSENQRLSLASQLANMQSQAQNSALSAYYQAQENEANRALQRQQIAAQNAYNKYLMDAANAAKNNISLSGSQNRYGGYDWTDGNGNKYTASQVAQRAGGSFNDSLYEVLRLAAGQGDAYSQAVLSELQNGYEFAPNTTGRSTGNAWYDTLGIVKTKDGRY